METIPLLPQLLGYIVETPQCEMSRRVSRNAKAFSIEFTSSPRGKRPEGKCREGNKAKESKEAN
jgi:hypothetical protein